MIRSFRGSRGFTLIELLVVIAIIAILAAILFPVFAKARDSAKASHCISNLQQIGRAFRMYASDYEDTFPTNKLWSGNPRTLGADGRLPDERVRLSDPTYDPDGDGNPDRFQYGVSFVEALYPFLERVTTGSDPVSIWKCPKAKDSTYPVWTRAGDPTPGTDSGNAAVTYVMNAYLCEANEGTLKSTADMMLLREIDARVNGVLRPTPRPITSGAPQYPFLDDLSQDPFGVRPKADLHAKGSHILFADGHAKFFMVNQMRNSEIRQGSVAGGSGDPYGRWTNKDGSIVITP